MVFKPVEFEGSGTFSNGVHPPARKRFSENERIQVLPVPGKVVLSLHQNIGGPCKSVVKARQKVAAGEIVGKGETFVSTTLHSPFSGVIKRTCKVTLANGRRMEAVPIEAKGEHLSGEALWDDIFGGPWPKTGFQALDPASISREISDAGIVGLGGAAFPTHVKIRPNDNKPIHTLLINGCECEPYLTSDYRLMIEVPDAIVTGALLAARSVGAKQILIGIEDNKPDAVEKMKAAAADTPVCIAVLKTKYPQGSEKHLIQAIVNRKVPLGGLPSDVGVAVSNVATVAAVARAIIRKKPFTHRVISVTGQGIKEPKNVLAPIGVAFGDLIAFCGGLTKDAARLIAGGPMMGFAFTNLDTPVTKGTGGLTVLTQKEVKASEETSCVRCGRCVDVCPMNLVPTKLAMASLHKDSALAGRYNIGACFECGSCAYTCPANIPLVQRIRAGKVMVLNAEKS